MHRERHLSPDLAAALARPSRVAEAGLSPPPPPPGQFALLAKRPRQAPASKQRALRRFYGTRQRGLRFMVQASMWSYELTEPYKFSQVEAAAPAESDLLEDEVLLRVLVGGICGSDLPYFKGMISPLGTPSPTGRVRSPTGAPLHEVVGEVIASRCRSLEPGAVVVGWATRMNAISEIIIVRGSDVHEFGPDLSPSVAIMLQPLACVIYAADSLTGIEGSIAAVIGQGPIGVLFSHVLKHRGAAKVIGIDRVDRSDLAKTFRVDQAVRSASDSWAALAVDEAERPDIIVEAVGHQVSTMVDATTALRIGGQIYYFGIPDDPIYPFPMRAFLRKNAKLISGITRADARRDVLARAEAYVMAYPDIVQPYISRTFKFKDVEEAFNVAIVPSPGRLKVTLEA
jgi:L-iditol 2-dehydrogenase